MPSAQSYRDLDVWQKAMELTVAVYELTRKFPKHELYGLTAQMRRAAVSVPANIVEGRGRLSRGEYAHHASIARGSLMELDMYLELTRRLKYATAPSMIHLDQLADDVGRMLTMLIRALRRTRPALG